MNNSLKTLLAAAVLVGTACADKDYDSTNKTFMSPRPMWTFDLVRQYAGIWDFIYHPKAEGKFGGFFNVTGAYNASTGSEKIGSYYGFEKNNQFTVGTCGGGSGATDCGDRTNIDRNHLIQRHTGNGELAGTFRIGFEKKRWDVQFDYYQDLGCIWRGLYLEFKLPVAHEKLEACLQPCGTQTNQPVCCNATVNEVSIADFFAGNISQACTATCYDGSTPLIENQSSLCFARIDNCSHSQTGVGDIDIKLGYNYLQGEDYNMNINLGLTIPTGNTPHGRHVAEPVVGNGGGVGFGGGFVNYFTPWKKNDKSLEMHIVLDYRYFFKHDECRTLGINNLPWAQYMATGLIGSAGVFPLANVLTTKVDVTRGSHVEALIGFAYHHGNFCFDLGYDVFGKEQESIDQDECVLGNNYGFAGWQYVSCNAFTTADIANISDTIQCRADTAGFNSGTGATLTNSDVSFLVAETPAVLTQRVYGSASYAFKKWEYPLLFRFGGYYEFSNTASFDTWSVFGGAGIAF